MFRLISGVDSSAKLAGRAAQKEMSGSSNDDIKTTKNKIPDKKNGARAVT